MQNLLESPTLRIVAKLINSLFDPLGIASPFAVRGRWIYRQCRLEVTSDGKVEWDQKLSKLNCKRLSDWVEALESIPKVSRKLPTKGKVRIFADASNEAYGSAIHSDNALVGGGSKLIDSATELKPIHFKELNALRWTLQRYTCESILEPAVTVVYTDNLCVYNWIQGSENKKRDINIDVPSRRRIEWISEWLHRHKASLQLIKSEHNAADACTRGDKAPSLANYSNFYEACKNFSVIDAQECMSNSIEPDITSDVERTNFDINEIDSSMWTLNKETKTTIIEGQQADNETKINGQTLSQLYNSLKNDSNIDENTCVIMIDEVIYYLDSDNNARIVVPKSLRDEIFNLAHSKLLHPGRDRTLAVIVRNGLWFPGIAQYVKDQCSKCSICQKLNNKIPKSLGAGRVARARPNTVFIDIVGPLPTPVNSIDSTETNYVFTMMDCTSGFVRNVHIVNIEAPTLLQVFYRDWIAIFGIPALIHSDNARQFIGDLANKVAEEFGIKLTTTAIYYPQGNSMLERSHSEIKRVLSLVHSQGKDYREYVASAQMLHNISPNKTTGISPFEQMFGRLPSDTLTMWLHNRSDVSENDLELQNMWKQQIELLQRLNFMEIDSNREINVDKGILAEGQTVKWIRPKFAKQNKLDLQCIAPCTIIKLLTPLPPNKKPLTAIIELPEGRQCKVSTKQLVIWKEDTSDGDNAIPNLSVSKPRLELGEFTVVVNMDAGQRKFHLIEISNVTSKNIVGEEWGRHQSQGKWLNKYAPLYSDSLGEFETIERGQTVPATYVKSIVCVDIDGVLIDSFNLNKDSSPPAKVKKILVNKYGLEL